MHRRSPREDGQIDWNQPAVQIERTIRAFDPWPGTFTHWEGKLLKIHRGRVRAGQQTPGSVVLVEGSLCVGTAEGLLQLEEVQLEGKKRLSAADFVRGYPQIVGADLGKCRRMTYPIDLKRHRSRRRCTLRCLRSHVLSIPV
jgi:methionyl-tRNA formyltransferase